jgi:hypothetical protein
MSKLVKVLKYNFPQLLFLVSLAKTIILEWGRGTGKSTIISKRIIDCVQQMPRSTGMIYGESYRQIKSRTLPSTIDGLEQHGYIKGVHYFVGEKPPKSWNWPEPYQPVTDHMNCIFWWNGTVIILVSQDGNASSGRGLNVDWIIGDEALLYDGQKFMTDASATNRGNLEKKAIYPDGTWKYFKDCRLHHSTMLASSTPISIEGQWFFKYEQEAMDPKNDIFFLRASATDNLDNLGADFFKNQKAIMPDFLYNAEVLNIRVGTITDGFYPKLDEKLHCYNTYNVEFYKQMQHDTVITCEGDDDLDESLPLIAAIDWGANINCMVIAQNDGTELKFLKNLYVKSPKILDDLAVEEFIPYYESHRQKNNVLHLFYDPSGNVSMANSRKTYAKQMEEILTKHGWNVHLKTRGQSNQSHESKFNLWNVLLTKSDSRFPTIRFNKYNCKELWISMSNAPAKRGTKTAIQKVKSSEKKKSLAQEHATHFSDTADLIVVGLFIHMLQGGGYSVPEIRLMP